MSALDWPRCRRCGRRFDNAGTQSPHCPDCRDTGVPAVSAFIAGAVVAVAVIVAIRQALDSRRYMRRF